MLGLPLQAPLSVTGSTRAVNGKTLLEHDTTGNVQSILTLVSRIDCGIHASAVGGLVCVAAGGDDHSELRRFHLASGAISKHKNGASFVACSCLT
jgi:hypothetical protein